MTLRWESFTMPYELRLSVLDDEIHPPPYEEEEEKELEKVTDDEQKIIEEDEDVVYDIDPLKETGRIILIDGHVI